MVLRKDKNREKTNLKKGIFILPNIFTSIQSQFAGCFQFFARLTDSMRWQSFFSHCRCFLDGLDGKVARATNAVSDFGKVVVVFGRFDIVWRSAINIVLFLGNKQFHFRN